MKKLILIIGLAAAMLSGCAATGTVAPTSVSQQLGYAEGTIAGVRQSCANATLTGTLSALGAQTCLADTDTARTAINAGNVAAASGDATTAAAKLALVNQLLLQIQTQLAAQGVK